MRLIATLDEITITRLLRELFPVTIALEDGRDDRTLEIAAAEHVDFVAGVGLRVRTTGRLKWTTAGISIPVTLNSVGILLRPEIAEDDRGGKLLFRPELEELDLKNVPTLLDQPIQNMINQRLEKEADRLAWHFGESFRLAVPLPPEISPPHILEVLAPGGAVLVTDHDLSLTVDVHLRFVTRVERTA